MFRPLPVLALTCALLAAPLATSGSAAERTPLKQFAPLPPAPPVSPSARAARDRLLGDDWDDPTRVTLSWTGVSSFVVTLGGHLLLFDAWEVIGAPRDYVPVDREDLAALDPEAILVGHGDYDHAGDVGYVAGLSGAVVVGADETCGVAEAGAEREGVPTDFRCAVTGTSAEPPVGALPVAAPVRRSACLAGAQARALGGTRARWW